MNKEFITTELITATNSLLQLARNESYNIISNNCLYIISEIHTSLIDVETQRKLSNEENRKKQPVKLSELISDFEAIYPLLYDINLYIYTANSEHTIIDIRYFPKSSLSFEYEALVTTNAPMLHCKITYPPYHKKGQPSAQEEPQASGEAHDVEFEEVKN